MPRSAEDADRRRSTTRTRLRGLAFGLAVVLGAVAVWLIVTGATQKRIEIGVLAGLWGLLLAAYSIFGTRRPTPSPAPDGIAEAGSEVDLRYAGPVMTREEAAARRAYEYRLEEMLRRQMQAAMAAEVSSLRAEIAALRSELVEKVGGQLRLERIETTRLIGSDLVEALQQEVRQLAVGRPSEASLGGALGGTSLGGASPVGPAATQQPGTAGPAGVRRVEAVPARPAPPAEQHVAQQHVAQQRVLSQPDELRPARPVTPPRQPVAPAGAADGPAVAQQADQSYGSWSVAPFRPPAADEAREHHRPTGQSGDTTVFAPTPPPARRSPDADAAAGSAAGRAASVAPGAAPPGEPRTRFRIETPPPVRPAVPVTGPARARETEPPVAREDEPPTRTPEPMPPTREPELRTPEPALRTPEPAAAKDDPFADLPRLTRFRPEELGLPPEPPAPATAATGYAGRRRSGDDDEPVPLEPEQQSPAATSRHTADDEPPEGRHGGVAGAGRRRREDDGDDVLTRILQREGASRP